MSDVDLSNNSFFLKIIVSLPLIEGLSYHTRFTEQKKLKIIITFHNLVLNFMLRVLMTPKKSKKSKIYNTNSNGHNICSPMLWFH